MAICLLAFSMLWIKTRDGPWARSRAISPSPAQSHLGRNPWAFLWAFVLPTVHFGPFCPFQSLSMPSTAGSHLWHLNFPKGNFLNSLFQIGKKKKPKHLKTLSLMKFDQLVISGWKKNMFEMIFRHEAWSNIEGWKGVWKEDEPVKHKYETNGEMNFCTRRERGKNYILDFKKKKRKKSCKTKKKKKEEEEDEVYLELKVVIFMVLTQTYDSLIKILRNQTAFSN